MGARHKRGLIHSGHLPHFPPCLVDAASGLADKPLLPPGLDSIALQVPVAFFGEHTASIVPASCVLSLPEALKRSLHTPKVRGAKVADCFRLAIAEIVGYLEASWS